MLVKTLVPREEEDDEISDGVQCYVPGIVQVVPLRKAPATKCYTILRFNGKKVRWSIPVETMKGNLQNGAPLRCVSCKGKNIYFFVGLG